MKKITLLSITMLLGLWASATNPKYATKETEEIILKMIEAHGGYEKWSNLETLSFTTTMHSESLGFIRFWISSQVVDMKKRRSYQDWPLVGSKMTFDGEKVWSEDWRIGNPPSHQHSVFYYYINLPWITQDDNVVLGNAELVKHVAFANEVYKIRMSFKDTPTVGKSAKDTYTLFIDSKTNLLAGYEYEVGYGPLLDILKVPKNQEVFGPVLRKINYSADIEGLKFPILFTTHDKAFENQYGDHAVYKIELDSEFDESRMMMPSNAVIDPAKDVRKE